MRSGTESWPETRLNGIWFLTARVVRNLLEPESESVISQRKEEGVIFRDKGGKLHMVTLPLKSNIPLGPTPNTAKMDKSMARIRFGLGLTIRLGEFEAGRIDVGVEMPCENTIKDLEQTYEVIRDFVAQKVDKEAVEMKKAFEV